MSRTIRRISFNGDQKETEERIHDFLVQEDYREISYDREIVWKKGTGIMSAMHYIKIEFKKNELVISGWVRIGIGDAAGKEQALSGILGMEPKKAVLKTIKELEEMIV